MLGNLRLRDMKKAPREKSEDVCCAPGDESSYPYGLRLSLDKDALETLAIGLPDVGDAFFVVAVAKVKSVSEHEDGENKTQHVELQIEQLSLDGDLDGLKSEA